MSAFRLGFGATCLVVTLGCGESSPAWEWPVQTPAEQGMDATVLDGARAYAFQEGKNTQGVVVTRRGALVAEWYADGAGPDSYAASWSMAKSFTSALVGIALEEGLISDLDVSMADYYPGWSGTPYAAMRLEHVLHMASGLEWDESYEMSTARDSDVVQLVFTTESPLDYVLARPLAATPGTVFLYSSGDALLLSGVLAQATGMTAGEYAQDKLFSRLDIEAAEWWRAKTGETLTYCCLDMTSRDFARFGLLYMHGGDWSGKQVVPPAWVADSLDQSPLFDGYGYQWWLQEGVGPGLPADIFAALGHDGQYLYVIPSLELVVVRNGSYVKDLGEAVADPTLFLRYPPDGLTPGAGTVGPDSWSDAEFLAPILDSIVD